MRWLIIALFSLSVNAQDLTITYQNTEYAVVGSMEDLLQSYSQKRFHEAQLKAVMFAARPADWYDTPEGYTVSNFYTKYDDGSGYWSISYTTGAPDYLRGVNVSIYMNPPNQGSGWRNTTIHRYISAYNNGGSNTVQFGGSNWYDDREIVDFFNHLDAAFMHANSN